MEKNSKSIIKKCPIIILLIVLFFSGKVQSQTIAATDGGSPCSNCVPPGWVDGGGTPDISSFSQAAAPPVTGGGATWNLTGNQLPLPPNNHQDWISLRDLGSNFTEESVSTDMSGLIVGRDYEINVYSLTATTLNDGNNGDYYAGTLIDLFTYRIGARPIQTVNSITTNIWSLSKFRFTASATAETLVIFPGQNGAGQPRVNYETIQISITLNAINAVPTADNNTTSIACSLTGVPAAFNVTSTDVDVDGNIDSSTVDFDQATPGFQDTANTAEGSWSVDTNGNVTFTPISGFVGSATINYTVNDDFVLDGVNQSATSNVATLTVNVSNANDADCDGVPTSEDCDDNDATNTNSNVNDADCDGVPTSEDCDDNDATNTNSNVNDADCDGVPTSEDCDDNDATNTNSNVNDADCDGVPTSEDCDDNDATNTNSNVNDADCDGVP
ncbi:Ig-like domain-containing protein, partial [Xanthomarina sp. F2636L]|uniref:Ig-like domain-containing protein n=1 Tax=Xanthomarina sp. F2636L TaxID=2996018 RepID=UPI00225E4B3F